MNKHIELVKKWLADKDSVSQEELQSNSAGAYYVVTPADSGATWAAYDAAYFAAVDKPLSAAHYVTRYEDLTNEV